MSNSELLTRLIISAVVLGASIGAGIGVIASVLGKRASLGWAFVIDAVLGAIGFAGTRIFFAFAPIQGGTITRHVGNAIITTTMRRFQYPNRVAFPVAILLPLIFEFFQTRRLRK